MNRRGLLRLSPPLLVLLAALPMSPRLAAQPPFRGIYLDNQGNVGIGTDDPQSRLHVAGDSLLGGVIRGLGFGGRWGTAAAIQGFNATGTPPVFVLAWDGTQPAGQQIQIYNAGSGAFKTFIIPHPLDAGRYLVHATLEGPEGAVYYRGSARLEHGEAEIVLPPYFEALTQEEGRTVLLTNVGGFDRLAVRPGPEGHRVEGGRFTVYSENPASTQAFDWEVKAVRRDKPPLEVEPRVSEVEVGGIGPYTFRLPEVLP